MKSKTKVKFFPFSPGIPWTMKSGHVVPKIDMEIWNSCIQDKSVVVTAFGGWIESFMSLSYFEVLRNMNFNGDVYWIGDSRFEKMVLLQGIAKISSIDLRKGMLEKFPVPLFFDKKNNAYFNCLNNYRITKTWYGKYPTENKEIILRQIFSNSLVEWKEEYVPKLRKINSEEYQNWAQSNRFRGGKYIVIFPDGEGCLGWSLMQLKEFVAIMRGRGISIVICSNNLQFYYGMDVYRTLPEVSIVMNLIKNAWMILSEQIDFLLISLAISKAMIFSKIITGVYDLFESANFLGSTNIISCNKVLKPIDVFGALNGQDNINDGNL